MVAGCNMCVVVARILIRSAGGEFWVRENASPVERIGVLANIGDPIVKLRFPEPFNFLPVLIGHILCYSVRCLIEVLSEHCFPILIGFPDGGVLLRCNFECLRVQVVNDWVNSGGLEEHLLRLVS